MESVFRAIFMYVFLLIIIRISGARTLSEMTTFDFVLLLIIGDSTQQAIVGEDFSLVGAVVIITTFFLLDIFMSFIKNKWPIFDKIIDGSPLIIVSDGKPIKKMMDYAQINTSDVLEAARERGLERMDQIKFAILEKSGHITIIPYTPMLFPEVWHKKQ